MSFQQQIAIRRNKSFSQKMNEDMHNSVKCINFDFPVLGSYIALRFNNGKHFTEESAEKAHITFSKDFIIEFEKDCNVKQEYSFNELKYFKNSDWKNAKINPDNNKTKKRLNEITIPDTWKIIHSDSFSYFEALKKVHLGKGIEEIGDVSFFGCRSLNYIHIPNNVKSIMMMSFYNSGLKYVRIPASVAYLGSEAFAECPNLEKVKIDRDSNLTVLNSSCFGNSKIPELKLPDSIKFLCIGAFKGSENLKYIKIPKKADFIPFSTFADSYIKTIDLFLKNSEFKLSAVRGADHVKKIIIHNRMIFQPDNETSSFNSDEDAIPKEEQKAAFDRLNNNGDDVFPYTNIEKSKVDLYIPEKFKEYYSDLNDPLYTSRQLNQYFRKIIYYKKNEYEQIKKII